MRGLRSDNMNYSRRRQRNLGWDDVALLWVFGACLATFTPPILAAEFPKGLELAEAISANAIEGMKTDMSINFLEAALLRATMSLSGDSEGSDPSSHCVSPGGGDCSWPTYSLTDADGVLHTCTVHEEPPKEVNPRSKTSSRRDVATALESLNGRCTTLMHEYWNYEWCHRKNIKQFHKQDDGTLTVISLGEYKRTEVKRINVADTEANADTKTVVEAEQPSGGGQGNDEGDDGNGVNSSWLSRVLKKRKRKKDHAPHGVGGEAPRAVEDDLYSGIDLSEVAAIFDFYEDGDVCDETRKPRQTQVAMMCCATFGTHASGTFPPVVLVSIKEVAICTYLIRVCSNYLCPEQADGDEQSTDDRRLIGVGDSPSAPSGAMASGVMDILDSLEACFPTKHVDYWSYQLCFSNGIQQYHVDRDKGTDGNFLIRNSVNYSLGEFNRLAVEVDGENLVGEAEDGKPAIIVEFKGGTECDLTGVLRSSTVYLKCGVVQELKEVIEDRTCHYKIEAESPLLCRHEGLVQKEEPVRTVKCVVEGESKSETNRGGTRSTTQQTADGIKTSSVL